LRKLGSRHEKSKHFYLREKNVRIAKTGSDKGRPRIVPTRGDGSWGKGARKKKS